MALTTEQIEAEAFVRWGEMKGAPLAMCRGFARVIEIEVRKECAAELAALRTERDHMEMAADAEARRVDELTALRKQDDALILQLVEALEQLVACHEEPDCPAVAIGSEAITAARARLEGKP